MTILPNFMPRKYACPGGHYTPNLVNKCYQELCLLSKFKPKGELDQIAMQSLLVASMQLQFNCPYYWISRDLLMALLNTDPPKEMLCEDIPWPLNAFTVLLPINCMKDSAGLDLCFMSLAKVNKLQEMPTDAPISVIPQPNAQFENELMVSGFSENMVCWGGWLPGHKTISTIVDHETYAYPSEVALPTDGVFLKVMTQLGINILLYMDSCRPEDVEKGDIVRKASEAKGISELWSPSWIGQHYKIRREHLGGTHSSPRVHWRRGHVRMQKYGKGLSLTKQIRIEPVLVNA